MEMEADRMRNLRITEDDIVTERSVILEERAQRTDSNPSALFSEELRAALYMNHPYGVPIVGWRHEMEQLSREDALAFYRRFYAPNNAILIVAGDVSPDEVRALAEEHYGGLEPTPDLMPRMRPQEPPHLADRRIYFEDQRVARPYVSRAYLAPERDSGAQQEAAALTLLAQILGGSGVTAVLSRTLQIEDETSLFAGAYYTSTSYDDSSFSVVNLPVPGRSLEEAEADLDRVIATFLETGIDTEQLERIKFQFSASDIYQQDSVQDLAREYGVALTSGLTVADVQAWPEVIAATTPEDIMDMAQRIFTQTPSVTGYISPPQTSDTLEEASQ